MPCGSLADTNVRQRYVRFTPESGHSERRVACPLSANSGHSRNDLRKTKDRLAAVSSESDQVWVERALCNFYRSWHEKQICVGGMQGAALEQPVLRLERDIY